jgi:hypothetical protein
MRQRECLKVFSETFTLVLRDRDRRTWFRAYDEYTPTNLTFLAGAAKSNLLVAFEPRPA